MDKKSFVPSELTTPPTERSEDVLVSGVTVPDRASTEAYVVFTLSGFAYATMTLPFVASAKIVRAGAKIDHVTPR